MNRSKFIEYAIIGAIVAVVAFGVRLIPPQGPTPPAPIVLPEPTEESPLVLPAELIAEPGRMTVLKAKSLGKISWVIPPSVAESVQIEAYADHVLICPSVSGDFDLGAVVLWTPKDKPAEVFGPVWVKIRSGNGPRPPPDEKIKPTPTPKPFPPAKLSVVILEESKDRTPATTRIITSESLRKSLDASGHILRVYDQDTEIGKTLLAKVKAAGIPLPALVCLERDTGALRTISALPSDEAAVIEAARKAGGS